MTESEGKTGERPFPRWAARFVIRCLFLIGLSTAALPIIAMLDLSISESIITSVALIGVGIPVLAMFTVAIPYCLPSPLNKVLLVVWAVTIGGAIIGLIMIFLGIGSETLEQ